MKPLLVGSRPSLRTRIQTHDALQKIRLVNRDAVVHTCSIPTFGDHVGEEPVRELGIPGAFVDTLQQALIEKRVDVVVHSLKDLPVKQLPGLRIGAVLKRDDPRDALVSQGPRFTQLPRGAVIGTPSPRRMAQLWAVRPDLEHALVRGPIEARLRRLREGEFTAVVVSAAGLARIGEAGMITEVLDPRVCLPNPGQGVLALQIREDDAETLAMIIGLNDEETSHAVVAERAWVHRFRTAGGVRPGRPVPIAAYAQTDRGRLNLTAVVASFDGQKLLRSEASAPYDAAEQLGIHLADQMIAQEAHEWIAE